MRTIGRVVVAALVVALLGCGSSGDGTSGSDRTSPPMGDLSVNETLQVGDGPIQRAIAGGQIAIAGDAAWVTDAADGTVVRIDSDGRREAVSVGEAPSGIASSGDALWVALAAETASEDGSVVRVDVDGLEVSDPIPVAPWPVGVAVADGAVWVTSSGGGGRLTRIDAETMEVTDAVDLSQIVWDLALTDDAVWVASPGGNAVLKIDIDDLVVSDTIAVDGQPRDLAVSDDAVWASGDSLWRISRSDDQVTDVRLPDSDLCGVLATSSAVFVADHGADEVWRVRPEDGIPTGDVSVGDGPCGLASYRDAILVVNGVEGTVSQIGPAVLPD